MQRLCHPAPIWTYATPLPSSSFSFVVCQNYQRNTSLWFPTFRFLLAQPVTCSRILQIHVSLMARIVTIFRWLRPPCSSSIQIANLKSQIPSFAFHSEPHANAKLHYRSTPLSGYSAKSGSTRCPTNMAQGSQGKPSRVNNTKSILSVNSITTKESATPNVGKWRWQSSSQRLSRPFHSQDWLADVSILSHSLREIYYGIAALSQKRKTSIQVIFTQSSVSMTTTSEYLPVSGFNVPSLHLSQSLRLHSFQVSLKQTATIWATKVIPDLPGTISNCTSSKSNKTWTQTHNKGFRFVSSFIKQFPLPTQSRPSPMTQYMFQSNTSTTAAQNHECYLMHLRIKTNIPKQTVFACSFSLSPLSTNNLNTKFHRAFSAMTVPTYLILEQTRVNIWEGT